MKTVKRSEITIEEYRKILNVEKHHTHEIIRDNEGTLRWKENEDVRKLIDRGVELNFLIPLLDLLGYGKNSEIYRKLYRDIGYSLGGYWEVFYWEANNPEAYLYSPNSEERVVY